MKKVNHYKYSVEHAMWKYCKGIYSSNKLISELLHIEKQCKTELNDKSSDKSMWFRLTPDSSMVTTISDIQNDLNLPNSHPNHKWLIEQMRNVYSLNGDLNVYYS